MSCGEQTILNEECSLGHPLKTAADGSVLQHVEASLNNMLISASHLLPEKYYLSHGGRVTHRLTCRPLGLLRSHLQCNAMGEAEAP